MTAPAPPVASFTSADEAMDAVRAGLGYLAGAEVASLPAVTQARLLREYERAGAQHTAGRARVLAAFAAQRGYEDDACGSARTWLAWQTRVTVAAASGAVGWVRRLEAHPRVAVMLAAGKLSASYARQVCKWSDFLPAEERDAADRILVEGAGRGLGLADLGDLAEDMLSRLAPPDTDQDDDARFRDRWFRVTRLFQGCGRPDGDLTPECLAAVQEVLDTLGKKAGPEDDRTVDQRRHDALEEAMRLLLASGCLPERAGQAAQVQLHLTLDDLLDLPGAPDAAAAWLASLGDDNGQPGTDGADDSPSGEQSSGPADGRPASEAGGGPGGASGGELGGGPGSAGWAGARDPFGRPLSPAGRGRAAGAGEPGWLRGKAAQAYTCDAKIAPMVCGHLDRNLLAQLVAALLHPDDAAAAAAAGEAGTDGDADADDTDGTADGPQRPAGPRCACDEHPAPRPAAIPGALPGTSALPGLPAASGPGSLTSAGLARLQDTVARYATSLLSGPAGLASFLRTQLTGGLFPSASLPLDLGEPTEQVPPHLRRAVIKRDRHCSFPGCTLPPVRCHVHHLIPRSQGGPTRLGNLTLLCSFHHLIVIHRWGWALTLHADGTTTAASPDGTKVFHSHGPPPGQDTLWADPPGHDPPATAA